MNSCLYFGEVSHHRKSPRKHDLRYDVYMAHLFLDEVDDVFKDRWLWSVNRSNLGSFHRSDYHQPETQDLAYAVQQTMSEQLGREISGPISIITHLRTFGYLFQPGEFLFPLERRAYPPHHPDGGNHQHTVG